MGLFGKGSIKDRKESRAAEVAEQKKQQKEVSERELKEKMKQIDGTLTKLRAHELMMQNRVELQRQAALEARANPANKSRFVRELRKLEYYYVCLWHTQDLQDALESKEMEVQMALDTKEGQEAFTLAGKLVDETLVDLDKMLGKRGERIGMNQSASAIDRLFDSYVQKRGSENPFSEDYIEMLLSGNATAEDMRNPVARPVVVDPESMEMGKAAPADPAGQDAEDRFSFMTNMLGDPFQ